MAYRILIVDDSPAMRAFVRRVIRLSGFDVAEFLEAGDGQIALEVLRREWVDLVLTDINMPAMDGEEFLRRVASDDVLKSIPVFVVSTDATASRIGQMLALGARGYIVKPFVAEDLRRQLERSLGVEHA